MKENQSTKSFEVGFIGVFAFIAVLLTWRSAPSPTAPD
jgi:hypothetical protein